MSGAAVMLEGIGKSYGAQRAVHPLDLTVEGGTLVTLLGPSGCGKTTLLRMVAGLETPSEGRLLIGGRDVTRLPPGARNVSMVFQSYALFPHMSVGENVAYGLVSGGMGRREAAKRAEAALEGVGLAGFASRLPSEMSGGQQQRVAVARALVLEPEVLLFDEPLSNLDAKLRRSMREEIRALQQRLGLTVLYVTHDQGEAMAVADRIVVMQAGRIAQQGTPEALYTRPASRFVAGFMGEANLAEGVLGPDALDIGGLAVPVDGRGLPHGPCPVVIRPEAIRLHPAGTPGALPARVLRATCMGGHAEATLETPIGTLFALVPGGFALTPRPGPAAVTLDPAGVVPLPRD